MSQCHLKSNVTSINVLFVHNLKIFSLLSHNHCSLSAYQGWPFSKKLQYQYQCLKVIPIHIPAVLHLITFFLLNLICMMWMGAFLKQSLCILCIQAVFNQMVQPHSRAILSSILASRQAERLTLSNTPHLTSPHYRLYGLLPLWY